MNACRKYEERLESHLDGRLSAAEAAGVETHLGSCAGCREAFEAAREAGALLRAAVAPAPEPGASFWAGLRTEIAIEEARREQQYDFWNSLEALARRFAWSAAAAVALLTVYLAAFDAVHEPGAAQQTEIREIFPNPVRPPADNEEVLLTLVSRENGR